MSITLYLMTQKGYKVLESIIRNEYANYISQVVIGKDQNVDDDNFEDIVNLCECNAIKYYERGAELEISSQYSMAISWRWLIPKSDSKLIILHDSLLPKYRGFAPLVSMLLNREEKIGVTAIFATEAYDEGDIIAQSSTEITYPIRIKNAIDLVVQNYIEVALQVFDNIKREKKIIAIPQNDDEATYSLWRDEEDYLIDWNNTAEDILNFINAVSDPYKGASTLLNRKKIRILEAEIFPDVIIEHRQPGKVIFTKKGKPVIVCKEGLLKLNKVVDDASGEYVLPFKNFRVRLGC